MKVIWYTEGNIFEIMPGFTNVPVIEDMPDRKRGINKNMLNHIQKQNKKYKQGVNLNNYNENILH